MSKELFPSLSLCRGCVFFRPSACKAAGQTYVFVSPMYRIIFGPVDDDSGHTDITAMMTMVER